MPSLGRYPFTRARRSLPGFKNGTRLGGTDTRSPVLGLRPTRGGRCRTRKLPKPRSSTLSPLLRASMILVRNTPTMPSVCVFGSCICAATRATKCAFVIIPYRFDAALVRRGEYTTVIRVRCESRHLRQSARCWCRWPGGWTDSRLGRQRGRWEGGMVP